jgi:hypothetical protein
MHVQRCGSPEEFLSETLAYRDLDPLRTNVMATVATGAIDHPQRYESCHWWVVRDASGQVAGAAFRTAPHVLGLGPMPEDAAVAVARDLAGAGGELPGLVGQPQLVNAFLDAYSSVLARRAPRFVTIRRDVLYTVDRVAVPAVPGEAVVATEADLELAESLYGDFAEEVDGARGEANEASRASMRASLHAGRLCWWRDRDEIVSMAAHNLTIATPGTSVTRVGPVFTPMSHRRHGYGAAVSAAVTADLLGRGSRVMLFADESNATSNGVYRSLGYRAVDTLVLATARADSRQ